MHSVSHTLALRAPPASRTRPRWQPYTGIQPLSAALSRSPTAYLTPSSCVSSPTSSSRLCESDRYAPSSVQSMPHIQIRDLQKTRYAMGLVDQAVNCLNQIWQPQDIPLVFLTSSPVNVTLPKRESPFATPSCISLENRAAAHYRYIQLPSPISPSSQPSPLTPPSPTSSRHSVSRISDDIGCNLVPLKGFVHEVLRRSRTSGSVLQTALCYLEAIRSKVPELVYQEKSGQGVRGEDDRGGRIAKEEEEVDVGMTLEELINTEKWESQSPIMQGDASSHVETSPSRACRGVFSVSPPKKSKEPSPLLPPLPPLPSPLLCPRRAFLASLILASKFTQDRCFSNRAWAKLSGLPPREIGRCERALGDALQWRLWVGKKSTSSASDRRRGVMRCRSEGDLTPTTTPSTSLGSDASPTSSPSTKPNRGLRRHSTAPASFFTRAEPSLRQALPIAPPLDWETKISSWMPTPAAPWTPPYDALLGDSDTPPTPTLTSPSSTDSDSSGGDRTVQMSTTLDLRTPPNGGFGSVACGGKLSPACDPSFWGAPCGPHIAGDVPTLLGYHRPNHDRDAEVAY